MFLVDQIKADLASAHVRQQAGRFVRLTVVAFGAQIAAIGSGHLGRDALIGAAVGAVEAAYRQWAQVVPWAQLGERLHLVGGVQVPAGPAPVVSPAAPTVTAVVSDPPAAQ